MTRIKIDGIPSEKAFNAMPLGRQSEHWEAIKAFKAGAKTAWLSQKRKASATSFREFVKLHNATQYYAVVNDSNEYRDDSFQVWFT